MRPAKVNWRNFFAAVLLACGMLAPSIPVAAPGDSDIRTTRHNLSNSGTSNRVSATSETQVCVFCHTPHNAAAGDAPLWNRKANVQTYTRYTSSSLDANTIASGFSDQPGGSSLLCLSCHDGMVALGEVGVLPKGTGTPGSASVIAMSGSTDAGKIPVQQGVNTGYTRIGTDLTNDHPISITYNNALATADGELATMDPSQRDTNTSGDLIGIRSTGYKPLLPLERTGPIGADGLKMGQMQCATCHDPHLKKSKFLRLNRMQTAPPTGGAFNKDTDIICLACHTKLGTAWSESAHANPTVADETYTGPAAALRDFPDGANTAVWQAGCLNCHDTHTVQGSRRLLREGVGTDATLLTVGSGPALGATYQAGVNPNIGDNNVSSSVESTCFQCHMNSGGPNAITAKAGSIVPSIKSLFDLEFGMPVRSDDQADPTNTERHDIKDANFTEPPENMGLNNPLARHAECTDCHNPHRLRRNSKFNGLGDSAKRTHDPRVGGPEGNVASGVLRGSWGVQPTFLSAGTSPWPMAQGTYTTKKGDPALSTSTATSSTYLTREYQLCFKCHSDWSNSIVAANFPKIGYSAVVVNVPNPRRGRRGTQIFQANGMLNYTNVASEFASVKAGVDASGFAISGTDQGEVGGSGSTACGGAPCIPAPSFNGTSTITTIAKSTNNHRSWHPVMWPTGRDRAARSMDSTGAINLRAPFDTNIGKQTMQCSDCHGQSSSYTPGAGPIAEQPQGPHGSDKPFLLRNDWDLTSRIGSLGGKLCGNCHQPGGNNSSGYRNNHTGPDAMATAACMFCHVAVPHGWKNKAFLVNLNCVGREGGQADDCTAVGDGRFRATYLPPYYNAAKLSIGTWARSGNWNQNACNGGMTSCGGGTAAGQ
jgi:hypothetical protein